MIHASAMAWMMLPWFKEREWTVRFPQIFLSAARARLAVWLKIPWVVASRCLSNLQWGGPHCRSISSYALRRPEVARWGPSMTQLPCQVMDGGWWGFDVLICFDIEILSEIQSSWHHIVLDWILTDFALRTVTWHDLTFDFKVAGLVFR